MNRYAIYVHQENSEDIVVSSDKFSIFCFVFGGFWLLHRALYEFAFFAIIMQVMVIGLSVKGVIGYHLSAALLLSISYLCSSNIEYFTGLTMKSRGYMLKAVLSAETSAGALMLYKATKNNFSS